MAHVDDLALEIEIRCLNTVLYFAFKDGRSRAIMWRSSLLEMFTSFGRSLGSVPVLEPNRTGTRKFMKFFRDSGR